MVLTPRTVRIPVWLALIAVLAGASLDAPALALGINAAACVLLVLTRPAITITRGRNHR